MPAHRMCPDLVLVRARQVSAVSRERAGVPRRFKQRRVALAPTQQGVQLGGGGRLAEVEGAWGLQGTGAVSPGVVRDTPWVW